MALDFRTASWKELKQEYKRLASEMGDDQFFTKKELRYLPETLMPDEQVEAFSSGMMSGNTWLIALTDQRIIMLDKGMIYGLKQIVIDLDRVNAVSCKTGIFFGTIIITDGANDKVITNVLKQSVKPFTNKIQTMIDRRKKAQRKAAMPKVSVYEELERLQRLKEKGALTDDEFQEHKAKLMAGQQNETAESKPKKQPDQVDAKPSKGWWANTKRFYMRAAWLLLAVAIIGAVIDNSPETTAANTVNNATQAKTDLHKPIGTPPSAPERTEKNTPKNAQQIEKDNTASQAVQNGNEVLAKLKPSLDMFRISNAGAVGDTIHIQMEDHKLDEAAYRGLIEVGICSPRKSLEVDLSGIRGFIVTNKSRNQGWLFKGGEQSCSELATAMFKGGTDKIHEKYSSPCSGTECSQPFEARYSYTEPENKMQSTENRLEMGKTYIVSRKTPIMTHHSPDDVLKAIEESKALMSDGAFTVTGYHEKEGKLWYQVMIVEDTKIGRVTKGWINSKALYGQNVRLK